MDSKNNQFLAEDTTQQPHHEAILSIAIPQLIEHVDLRHTPILSAFDEAIQQTTPSMTDHLVTASSQFYLTRLYLFTKHMPQLLIYRYDSEQDTPNSQNAWENAIARVAFDKTFENVIRVLPASAANIYPILIASTAIDIVARQLAPGIEKARHKNAVEDGNYLLAGIMHEAENDLFFAQCLINLNRWPAQGYNYLQQKVIHTLDYFRNSPTENQKKKTIYYPC